jgi:hypothetical protein
MAVGAVKAGRLTVQLSNTGKVLFPGDNITKGDLVAQAAQSVKADVEQIKESAHR